ncbi:MAG TPA: PH domain-containing protein [Anaerolineales bacterium]|nr:PH domain-containing protein [Anaerolineales bacterium]
MAKTYLQGLLGEAEDVLLETHQHWFVLFGKIFLELLVTGLLLGGVVVGFTYFQTPALYGLILLIIPAIGIMNDVLVWRNKAYVVTNRRVIQISGVFNKDIVDSSLEKVNDVKMSQSFFGRMFGYGDIEILTGSELGVNLFHEINDPVGFKTAMLNAKERMGFDNEAGLAAKVSKDIPTLIAELDELRKKGIISEVEFQRKKTQLLEKI